MKFHRIVYPSDFSHSGQVALHTAESMARDHGAELLLVHVEEPPMAYGGGELYYGVPEPAREDMQRMLDEIQLDPEVKVSRHLITGSPADAIVRFAEEQDADLIVLGTHGRTGLLRLLMGSVAELVVRRATCPVLTVRQPAKEPAAAS